MNKLVDDVLENNFCIECKKHGCRGCKKYRKIKNEVFKFLEKKYNVYEIYKNNSALTTAELLNKKFGISDFNNGLVMNIIRSCGYKLHTLKESVNLKTTRKKSEKTCLKTYGAINPLSKGTVAFEKRNKTVKERYGVDNVFQNEEIKQKITNTVFEKYGCWTQNHPDIQAKTKETYKKKFGCHPLNQRYAREKCWLALKKKNNYISKPDLKVQNFLKENNIEYKIEQTFTNMEYEGRKWAIVDILVNNIAFEVQGTYWHADPRFYIESDIVHHNFTAKELWDKDDKRKKFLEEFGLKVIFLWQFDIENNFENIKQIILKEAQYAH